MALNVKNYFYDVLPLDIQEYIFEIHKKQILQKCFNSLFNNVIDNRELKEELERRERNIYNNYKENNCSLSDVGNWSRSGEDRTKMFKYLEERMKRLTKYKNKIEDINEEFEEFEEEDAYFARIEKSRKLNKLLHQYITNDYIVYDYDDELLYYDDFTSFIQNL